MVWSPKGLPKLCYLPQIKSQHTIQTSKIVPEMLLHLDLETFQFGQILVTVTFLPDFFPNFLGSSLAFLTLNIQIPPEKVLKVHFWGPNTFSAGVWMSRLRWVAVVWNISIWVIFHPHDVLFNCFESSRCFAFRCFSPLSKNQRGPLPAIRLEVITPFQTIVGAHFAQKNSMYGM